jgi:hypothetical protein
MSDKRDKAPAVPDPEAYDEERIPFAEVMRKLVSTKPVHKVAAGPAKRNAAKPPKKL